MRKFLRPMFALLLLPTIAQQAALAQYTQPGIRGTAKLSGKLVDTEGRKLRGARVLAYHLSSAALYTSETTGGDGKYRITDMVHGYYDVAVETPDGEIYLADRVVNMPPSGSLAAILTLAPFEPATAALARKHPGSERDPSGTAELTRKPKGREFWRSPKGVAIIGTLGGVALIAIAVSSDPEETASVN
jgi:hypothetical protein